MTDHYEKNHSALAHEIWAAAQLAPGEGIADGVARVEAMLSLCNRSERDSQPVAYTATIELLPLAEENKDENALRS